MKKIKKGSLLLVLGMSSVMGLSSCNGGGSGLVDDTLPEDDPSSLVQIDFWNCLGHAKSANLDTIIDSFNEKYKGKYHVNNVKIAGDYNSLSSGTRTKIASNEIPALVMGYPDNFSTYMGQNIDNSALLRLGNFINDKKFGYSKEELDDFVEAFYKEGGDYQFEGQWSMPMYKSTEVMYYNVSYLAGLNDQNANKFATNVEYNDLANAVKNQAAKVKDKELNDLKNWVKANGGYAYDVPETWEQMVSTARQMKADMKTEGIEAPFYPVGYDSDSNLMITQFAMRGIDYTTNENISKPADHVKFNNEKAKAFVKEVADLIDEKLFITEAIYGNYTNKLFTSKQCAFAIGSTGGSSYQVSSNFGVRIAPVPHPEGKTAKYIQQGPSIAFFNNDNSYIHKGAWLFYKHMASPENNVKLALSNSYDPVRKSSFSDKFYTDWIAKAGRDLKYDIPAATSSLRDSYMTSSVFLGSETARKEVGKIVEYVIKNRLSLDDAFKTAYDNTIKDCK